MTIDPIVEEVRAAREKLFEACNNDLDALLRHLKDQEQQDQSRLVSRKDLKAGRKRGTASNGHPEDAENSESVPAREP